MTALDHQIRFQPGTRLCSEYVGPECKDSQKECAAALHTDLHGYPIDIYGWLDVHLDRYLQPVTPSRVAGMSESVYIDVSIFFLLA